MSTPSSLSSPIRLGTRRSALATVVGLALIVRGGASARKQAVPFGPFLALGGVVALWFGDALVDWYLTTFFNG